MRASAISGRAGVIGPLVAGNAVMAMASGSGSVAQAQAVTDFDLTVSGTTLPSTGGTAEAVVSIDPGKSAGAALGATVTIHTSTAVVVECVALVGLGTVGLLDCDE